MPLDDDDPEKWKDKEHTEVKHRILQKYLTTWTRILSSSNPEVHFFDGFAGRATYDGERKGSPILALDVADRQSASFEKFHCTFNEYNDNNFDDLREAVNAHRQRLSSQSKIEISYLNKEFEEIALDVMRSSQYRNLPSLVFIDQFGYDSASFNIVDEIMNLQQTGNEVFFTFMVDKIRRFLSDSEKAETITQALGTEDWKYIRNISGREKKEEELLKVYRNQLKETAGVDYVFPFQMKHPDKDTTVYYLIHATNHFKGFKVMKDVMFKEGADELFAYLGADHYGYEEEQTTLFESTESEDVRIKELANLLYDRFEGKQLRFWEILKRTYTETDLIETHYRDAIDKLLEKDKATLHNYPEREKGSPGGKCPDDEIEFTQTNKRLTDF